MLTRSHWLLVTLFSILLLAAGGAFLELAGLSGEGRSVWPLLVWIAVFFAAAIPLVLQVIGATGSTGQMPGVEEVFDVLPVGAALYGADGNILHCNEIFRQAFPDSGMHADFETFAAAIADTQEQQAEFGGERKLADGRWLRLERRELPDGGFMVTAEDISPIASLEADLQAAGERFHRFLSTAAEWIWETDILHRFVMARPVGINPEQTDFGWMTGRNPVELTAAGSDADRLAARSCMLEMSQHNRLSEVALALDAGDRTVRMRLNGLPRYDDHGMFLGYRGVGLREPVAVAKDIVAQQARPAQPAAPLLLVDDSATNRMLATTILNRMGYEVDAVADGRGALEAVRDGDYSAVLMDIWMPEMDGFEATAAIRALPGPKAHIPVIAMTAHTGVEERRRCLAAGMDEHVGKPIDRAALATILHQLAGPPTNPAVTAKNRDEPAVSPEVQTTADLVKDEVLSQLRNDAGPALLTELIAAFMAETDDRLVRIAEAKETGDMEEIASDAHAMKSSSGTFGALPLQALSARLEAAAMHGDMAALTAAHGELQELVSETWREFGKRGYGH